MTAHRVVIPHKDLSGQSKSVLFRMKYLFLYCALLCSAFAAPAVWNSTIGPYPPYQPKENGCQSVNYQFYHLASTGEVILDLIVPGFVFSSYSYQTIMSTAGGEVDGIPNLQVSYDNYADPSSDTAVMLADYNTQTCTYGQIEGYSPYPGYNYYNIFLDELIAEGITVYFEYVDLPDYGLCLQYTTTPPWVSNDDSEPRVLTYTLAFQNSTGYLFLYSLVGTEYCCPGENIYCPNSGLCADGSEPQLTNANTSVYYSNYQIYSNTSWADGFFGAYCPFTSIDATDDNNNNNDDSSNKGTSLQTAFAVLFGIFFGFALVVCYSLHLKLKEARAQLARLAVNVQSSGVQMK